MTPLKRGHGSLVSWFGAREPVASCGGLLIVALSCHSSQAVNSPPPWGLATVAARASDRAEVEDRDGDGLDDAQEQSLAERFAPVIWHASNEPNLPANVDWFLGHSRIGVYDDSCNPILQSIQDGPLDQNVLLAQPAATSCPGTPVRSDATRSKGKHRTFFLEDVDPKFRRGPPTSAGWTTYYHAYRNTLGGITIQYWRFYAYNTGVRLPVLRVMREVGFHGGDWEGTHVVLGADLAPRLARFLGHRKLKERLWSRLQTAGDHVMVYSEGGGHSSYPEISIDTLHSIRQETWSGGMVRWLSGEQTAGGPLVNIGEKTKPLQAFIRYSGLWGSPGVCLPVAGCVNSGYWGPAFNETEMRPDGFVTAWCVDLADPTKAVDGVRECFAEDPID